MPKIFLMMSVQNSSWQSKGEFEAEKKRCSEIGLTILEMNRYLKYPRDHLSFAKSLGLPLIISGAVWLNTTGDGKVTLAFSAILRAVNSLEE